MSNQDGIVHELLGRMRARTGIDLSTVMGSPIGIPWYSNPKGFKFLLKGGNEGWITLYNMLFINRKFCKDCGLGASFQDGHSFREISRDGSLHIILYLAKPEEDSKEREYYVNMHLDSVSCVTGRKRRSICCEYDSGDVMEHILVDLLKRPDHGYGDSEYINP